MTDPFPSKIPLTKPTDRPLSAAMARMYDVWAPEEDRGNEFYSNFKYSRLEGFDYGDDDGRISRRDPSKVLRLSGTYHVWYTKRQTVAPPAGPSQATEEVPSFDWDLAEVWYATSDDGLTWEEQGRAVERPSSGEFGCRSNCTPDILAWGGRFHLYYQAYGEIIQGGDHCQVTVAEADSPDGPWRPLGCPVVAPSEAGAWDDACIHDPFPLIYQGRIWLFYKGQNRTKGAPGNMSRAQGVAIADHPLGPFDKSPLNPVLNSGHETCLWPYREGIAAIVSLDGPEKNTVQYAADGLNFEMKSILQVPPIAPGPFVPDAFADNGDGRGITWGLCHINPDAGGPCNRSILARFDCDLSRDVDWPLFKQNNLRFDEHTYFQPRVALPAGMRQRIQRADMDRDTVL
ncbi:MAG TPA: family 43 glycosylhydrolase [Armatimonadota bacterium]|nr:family 43 glycosylhydrolase [Armatimonadota bacterium]